MLDGLDHLEHAERHHAVARHNAEHATPLQLCDKSFDGQTRSPEQILSLVLGNPIEGLEPETLPRFMKLSSFERIAEGLGPLPASPVTTRQPSFRGKRIHA